MATTGICPRPHPDAPRWHRTARRRLTALLLFGLASYAAPPGTAWAVPVIQHWQTPNGVRVLFVETHQLPMVDIKVVFDAGSARDGRHAGLARLTSTLLNEGAGHLNVDQIAQRFEGVGAQYSATSERDSATIGLRGLTDPKLLDPAVETLATLLRDPTFPKAAFERERKRMLVDLRQQQESLEDIAERRFYAALYGKHPYATPPSGTEDSLKALTREQVMAFYHRYYVAANALVVIVGDVHRDAAGKLAEAVIGKLPRGTAPAPIPQPSGLAKSETVMVPHPSSQTHVMSGQVGITRKDKDYFPLYVGNHVLGGNGLVSRLSDEIREKRGLSYYAYSYFEPMLAEGPFVMGLQTRNAEVQRAIEVMNKTLDEFMAKGPTAKELKESKQNITGGFALRIDDNGKIARYLTIIGFYGLPLDYLNTFNDHVERVTLAEIRSAFKRHVHPDKRLTVIVGGGTAPTHSR